MQTRGKFIVLEGGEGSGKSSLSDTLFEYWSTKGSVVQTREPGGSSYAEEIRRVIKFGQGAADSSGLTQFLLHWAARSDHVENTIQPALEQGKIVISDRFDSATYAYQIHGQEARKLEPLFFEMRKRCLRNCVPDLYVFLDIPAEAGLRRARERSDEKDRGDSMAQLSLFAGGQKEKADHFDKREVDFHERVLEGFRVFMKMHPHVIVDASRSKEEVFREVLEKITAAIGPQ